MKNCWTQNNLSLPSSCKGTTRMIFFSYISAIKLLIWIEISIFIFKEKPHFYQEQEASIGEFFLLLVVSWGPFLAYWSASTKQSHAEGPFPMEISLTFLCTKYPHDVRLWKRQIWKKKRSQLVTVIVLIEHYVEKQALSYCQNEEESV